MQHTFCGPREVSALSDNRNGGVNMDERIMRAGRSLCVALPNLNDLKLLEAIPGYRADSDS